MPSNVTRSICLATILATALMPATLALPPDDPLLPPDIDADGDGVPDAIESQLCGRAATEGLINDFSPYTGSCASFTDYGLPNPTPPSPPDVPGPSLLPATVDADADWVPDAEESWICQIQDRGTPADGQCGVPDGSSSNYIPPWDHRGYTTSGDHVGMNGPGKLDVYDPHGNVYHAYNPPGCCAATSIPAGLIANGTWRIVSDVTSSGWPRFSWTIAGWSVASTDFLCGPSSPVTLYLNYDTRTYTTTCS